MNSIMMFVANFSPNISIAIQAMLVACLLPFLFAVFAKITGGFRLVDNANPREFLAKTTGMAARFNAAQTNSFESLPIFLAAVIVAMYCFVPQNVINVLAWLYVFLRIGYGAAYALDWSLLRSLLWMLGLMCCLALFAFAIIVV
ncbi:MULTISPECIES: MAPEG family protein [Moraxella]|uniref:MAPEG family protein n=1 Tax=Moraxella TaxID=475 RepID=UPI00359DF65E